MTKLRDRARITHSEATREKIREAAIAKGVQRADSVRQRVRDALATIEQEMAENNGTYPRNKGAISSAEVARRAGVHPTTFCNDKHRELGDEVKNWITSLKKTNILGRGPVRRELASRIEDWRRLYEGLAQSHRDTELELQQLQAELAELKAQLADQLVEIQQCRNQLAIANPGKVITFSNGKK